MIFAVQTVDVAQLVRASDCGSEGRGFETHHPPVKKLRCEVNASFGAFFLNPHSRDPHRASAFILLTPNPTPHHIQPAAIATL